MDAGTLREKIRLKEEELYELRLKRLPNAANQVSKAYGGLDESALAEKLRSLKKLAATSSRSPSQQQRAQSETVVVSCRGEYVVYRITSDYTFDMLKKELAEYFLLNNSGKGDEHAKQGLTLRDESNVVYGRGGQRHRGARGPGRFARHQTHHTLDPSN